MSSVYDISSMYDSYRQSVQSATRLEGAKRIECCKIVIRQMKS